LNFAIRASSVVSAVIGVEFERISQSFRPDPAGRCLNRPCDLSELMTRDVISKMPGEEGDDPKNKRRVFGISKCRTGIEAPPHDFYIKAAPTDRDPDRAVTVFGEYLDGITVDDLTKSAKEAGRPPDALEAAKNFLRDVLDDGPVEGWRVETMSDARKISRATLRRACKELGVEKSGAAGQKGKSMWQIQPKLSLVAQN